MNAISWMVYFSDIADNLRGLTVLGGSIILALSTLVCSLLYVLGNDYDNEAWKSGSIRYVKKSWMILVPIIFVGCLIPSKTTVMLIAASQVGETILTSQQGQQVTTEAGSLALDSMKVLRKYLDQQLGSSEPSK